MTAPMSDAPSRRFSAVPFRYNGPGGWTFVEVPDEAAPARAGAWGRAPVRAHVNGHTWDTSVWRDTRRGWMLPLPAKVRKGLTAGEPVEVELSDLPT
jgi:hypothetical protein